MSEGLIARVLGALRGEKPVSAESSKGPLLRQIAREVKVSEETYATRVEALEELKALDLLEATSLPLAMATAKEKREAHREALRVAEDAEVAASEAQRKVHEILEQISARRGPAEKVLLDTAPPEIKAAIDRLRKLDTYNLAEGISEFGGVRRRLRKSLRKLLDLARLPALPDDYLAQVENIEANAQVASGEISRLRASRARAIDQKRNPIKLGPWHSPRIVPHQDPEPWLDVPDLEE